MDDSLTVPIVEAPPDNVLAGSITLRGVAPRGKSIEQYTSAGGGSAMTAGRLFVYFGNLRRFLA